MLASWNKHKQLEIIQGRLLRIIENRNWEYHNLNETIMKFLEKYKN